jgi:glycosyltransferase involved in cell wall biosynthesis
VRQVTPRVTCLVPIHDQADLLPACLSTILAQSVADIEVLVSGDGCSDGSARVVEESGDPRVRFLAFPKAPGYGYANRARALTAARGKWVAYLAPDDLWARDHLERLLAGGEEDRGELLFSRPVLARRDGTLWPHYLPFDVWAHGAQPPVGARLLFVSPSQVLQSRHLMERAGGWSGALRRHGDVDLWLRCRRAGGRILYVPSPTVVRFPSYVFRGAAGPLRELHARTAEALATGSLDLARLGLAWPRRLPGWLTDMTSVAMGRGPALLRALVAR